MAKHDRQVAQQTADCLYEPLDWFVLRTPLLPIEGYFALGLAHQKVSTALSSIVTTDAKVTTALAVGNPNFFDALKRLDLSKQDADKDADAEKLMGKLLRLLTRMASRCTPMGMYAGLAIGRWDDKTDLSIGETGTRLRTRPDAEMIANLALKWETALLKDLQLVVNPTAALYANRVYVIEKAAVLNEEDVHGATIEATAEIKTIMSLARSPIDYTSLLNQLVESSEIPQADLEKLILQLVEITFLLTNLRLSNVVGDHERVLAILNSIPAAQEISERLNQFLSGASDFDASIKSMNGASTLSDTIQECQVTESGAPLASNKIDHATKYRELTAVGQTIFATKTGVSLQTDMQLSLTGNSVNRLLLKDVSELVRLTLGMSTGPLRQLAEYKKRFMTVYAEKEVPLLELVNPDVGLGLPSNLTDESSAMPGINQDDLTLLSELVHNAIRSGKLEVELPPNVVEQLLEKSKQTNSSDVRYPLSLDAMFTVIAESPAAIDAGNYLLVHSGGMIPGAGRLLGRFAYMLDAQAASKLDQLSLQEMALQPTKIFADISSLPRKLRLGNVSTIPLLRPFHIATDSWPDSSCRSKPLALDDLVVGLEQGRFYLKSISHGAEVIICNAHMANVLFGTALSKFLREISMDGVWIPSGFRWGALQNSSFLPRIRHQKLILCPAQWTIKPTDQLREVWKTEAGFEHWIRDWRQRWFVPRHIYLTVADNRLLLDLENCAQTGELRRELLDKQTQMIHVEEAFVGENDVWVPGPGGRFVNEFVAMFLLNKKQALAQESELFFESTFDPKSITREHRLRLPGTDCLFVKLYGGKNLEDELIGTSLLNVLIQLSDNRMIDSWFFIRYTDPDPHLRLRLFGDPQTLTAQVYPVICQLGELLVKNQLRKKITIETYEREVERYGGIKAIGLAEQLFACDSLFIAHLLQQERRGLWKEERLNTGAFTIDKMLEGLGLDAENRLAWYKPYTKQSKVAAGQSYRERKEALSKLFLCGNKAENSVIDAKLAQWQDTLGEVGRQYRELEFGNCLTTTLPRIYRSFIHIHCNRLGLDNQQEAIALALAERACQAVQSREKKPAGALPS